MSFRMAVLSSEPAARRASTVSPADFRGHALFISKCKEASSFTSSEQKNLQHFQSYYLRYLSPNLGMVACAVVKALERKSQEDQEDQRFKTRLSSIARVRSVRLNETLLKTNKYIYIYKGS